MKKLLFRAIVSAFIGFCCSAASHAQTVTLTNILTTTNVINLLPIQNPTITGGLEAIAQAVTESTNWAVNAGYGRGLKGNNNLVFADYDYNFVNSPDGTTVGLVLGFDEVFHGSQFNGNNVDFVKGGLSVSIAITPLASVGYTNFVLHPFASILMDSGNGQVGEIVVSGFDWSTKISTSWAIHAGGFYENRTGGDTSTDGNYIAGFVAFSRNWWFGQ